MSNFPQATAKIAAWNLSGYQEISADRLKLQAEGLAYLDAEVVALVEVNPADALDQLCAELFTEHGVRYESVLIEQPGSHQHIGVLFKTGVQVTNAQLLAGSEGEGGRQALQVEVKVGKLDFVMIVVHLKSGRGAEEQRKRDVQCQWIGQHITQLRTNPDTRREDIVLCGDFNMIPGQDISNFHHLGGDDLMDFVSSWDLQDRFSHILKKGRANLLDGFAITRTYSREYVRGSLRLFPMHWTMDIGRERYRETVSDHLPFVASFRINRDRD